MGPTDTPAVRRPGRWGRLRGIRPRLVAVLLVPTLAAVGFGALRMEAALSDSAAASRAETVADALPDSFRLAVQLTVERDAASTTTPAETLQKVEATTDAAIAAWRRHLPDMDTSDNPELGKDLDAARDALDSIRTLRTRLADPATREDARATYTTTLNTLLGLAGRLPALDDQDLYRQTYALGEIRTASEALGVEREVVGKAIATGRVSHADLTSLTRAQTQWSEAAKKFYGRTSSAARADFDEISGDTAEEGSVGAPMQAAVDRLVTSGKVDDLGLDATEWQAASVDFIGKMVDVIVQAASDLSHDVSDARSDARRGAILNAVVVGLVLLLAVALALLAARSILRPLRQLRQTALDIARRDLPARVREIEQADGPVDVSVEPIELGSRDEIAEVADAFGAVHAEAVRLAGEQAQMRANVNRMFVNLAHRSQGLVERQLRLIDELEASEQDPDDLANLFRLDHLATRMRRNDESLLVLAGGDTGQAARADVPVVDALRAAASEVEQFARVRIESRESGAFRGQVAADLVHLFAELVENATNFSPPDTAVVVRTTRAGAAGPLVVEVADHGIGMTQAELAAANAKLQRDSGLHADVARMMGLVVASRLAHRHGLTVKVGPNAPRGVLATVMVPAQLLAGEDGTAERVYARPSVVPAPRPAAPIARSAPVPAADLVGSGGAGSSGGGKVFELSYARRTPGPVARPFVDPLGGTTPLDVPAGDSAGSSPIFAKLQSEWFTRFGSQGWSSPGDAGWRRAAEVTTERTQHSFTAGGLPVRVPGRNLIPGAAPAASVPPAPAAGRRTDRRVRGLSSFQQGVDRARHDRHGTTEEESK